MPEKIILAQGTVYVSANHPLMNYFDVGRVKVGFSEYFAADWQPNCAFEHIGLLQFAPFRLPEDSRILNVRLHLFVQRTKCMTSCIQVYPNLSPFDARTVNWKTKPAIGPEPVSAMFVRPEDQCGYISCDITQLVNCCHKGSVPGFGVSLIANRENWDTVVFCSDRTGHPAYVSIVYDKCGGPPCTMSSQDVENRFYERIFEIEATDNAAVTQSVPTARAEEITFFVKNTGEGSFQFNLQISPDGTDFLDDKQTCTLQAGEMQPVTPYLFAKYMRACIKPVSAGGHAKARIWCQMQTRDYVVKSVSADLADGNTF